MTTRPPPFVPPPSPLGAPPVPVPPPAPAPLPSAEKARHLFGAFGAFVGGIVLIYLAVGLGPNGQQWIGPGETVIGVVVGLALVAGAGLLLLPFYSEWHATQVWRAYHADSLYHAQAHYARTLQDQAAWAAVYLRERPAAVDPPVRMRVMGVERPLPTDEVDEDGADLAPEPARVAWTPTEAVERVQAAVGAWLHRDDPPAPPPERVTERLPVLQGVRPTQPPPRVVYTADMRWVVRTAFEGPGTIADLRESGALPRLRWDAACKPLGTAGVLVKGKGGAWVLAPRFVHYGHDYGLNALHARVERGLQPPL